MYMYIVMYTATVLPIVRTLYDTPCSNALHAKRITDTGMSYIHIYFVSTSN
jgi:hypothetical protein